MITITDQVGTSGSVTVDKDEAAEAIRGWYPDAPTDVTEAIEGLQTALTRGESTYEIEALLGIEIKA